MRLDQALVEQGICDSREQAKRAILAGTVRVNEQRANKPSDSVKPGDVLALDKPPQFVSRGGHKLEHALDFFQIDPHGFTALDIGASTGGFTDCLLQRGAAKVYAIDVGHGQLAWKLRTDPRVIVMEKTNARELSRSHFPPAFEPVDLAVMDCSFISLKKVVVPAVALLRPFGKLVALVKPQFEAGKAEVDKGEGVIKDPRIHERVLSELRQFVATIPTLEWRGVIESPLLGPAGNKEFLLLLEKTR
jgi:23S rRNA (cytidine1920-2'-O)/16S rRNA (cytidine1409-2'-O)-methyltransferase